MAEFSNPADPARLSRRALQTRALAAARVGQLPPRRQLAASAAGDDPWLEQPPDRVRWTFDGRLGWIVAIVIGVVLIGAALWAISGMPTPPTLPADPPPKNPMLSDQSSAAQSPDVPGAGEGAQPTDSAPSDPEPSQVAQEPGHLVVHVAGAVAEPGVVELPGGSRISDAVAAAGGVTEDADLSRINLASWVVDGERVYVLSQNEAEIPQLPATASGASETDSPAQIPSTGGGESALVNLNIADSTQLQVLSGIGPALAQRIIDHREQFGPFTSLQDLGAVSGIGPVMLRKLDGNVTW